jgi:hypothetical protein
MAKAKDLAALAALAGLAYANRDKLFGGNGKDDKRTDARSPGDEMSVYAANRGMPDEEPRRKIEDYIKKAPLDGTEMYPSGVMGGARQADAVKPPKVVKPAAEALAPTSDPRNLEAGMSRGTRPIDPRQLEAGMSRGSRYKQPTLMKKGGVVNKMASGGMTASSRADGIATKGKTRGKIC